MSTEERLTELARHVQRVRRLQKDYFRNRDNTRLAECRDAERRLDKAVAEILNPTGPSLFGGDPGG